MIGKIKVSTIAQIIIALIGICGIGYTILDNYQELMTFFLSLCLLCYKGHKSGVLKLQKKHYCFSFLIMAFCVLICISYVYSLNRMITFKYALQFGLLTIIAFCNYQKDFMYNTIITITKLSVFVTFTVIFSVIFPDIFKMMFGWYFADKNAVYQMIDQRLAVGIVGHNAYASGISNLCIGYCMASMFSKRNVVNKDWIIGIIGLLAVLMTGKRILLVSLGITILVLLFLNISKEQKKRILLIILIGIIVFLIMYTSIPASRRVVERIIDGLGDSTFNNRAIFWSEAMYLFSQKKLLGWGFGVFPYYDKYFGSGWGYSAHNQYFELLAELGLIGLVLFCLIVSSTLGVTIKLLCDKNAMKVPMNAFITFFVFYYQMWYVIYGLTGTPLYNYSQQFLFVVLSMFTISLYYKNKWREG